MRDWAVGQAGGSCYSWAALSSNDSKIECDQKGRWSLGLTAFNESYGITAEEPKHFGYGFGRTLLKDPVVLS